MISFEWVCVIQFYAKSLHFRLKHNKDKGVGRKDITNFTDKLNGSFICIALLHYKCKRKQRTKNIENFSGNFKNLQV